MLDQGNSMQKINHKKYPTIGCCGINCGLCPRYYTEGKSKCPGCFGADFVTKHPSCSFVTCCVKNRHQETCATCMEFPCKKYDNWQKGDSFVTHQNCMENLISIREKGIHNFVKQQKERMNILKAMLEKYNDGKSKSFYCLAAGILPIIDLNRSINEYKMKYGARNDQIEIARIFKTILIKYGNKKHIRIEYKRK
jgi:hypothetical protein